MSFSAGTVASASPAVQTSLTRFDLFTILVTNETVSKRTRAILNTSKTWEVCLSPDLQITTEFLFDGVHPSINRLNVLRGLYCYVLRRNQQQSTSALMSEKESGLWHEVYRDAMLYNRVRRYCQVTDPAFRFPDNRTASPYEWLSVEETIKVAEDEDFDIGSPIQVRSGLYEVTIRPSEAPDTGACLSRLLPFDIPEIDSASSTSLRIENMSFMKVSGWLKVLPSIRYLTITRDDPYLNSRVDDVLTSLIGMPYVLPSLTWLSIYSHSDLKSLRGMPEMPNVETLLITGSIKSLEGMPKELPSLTKLDLARCTLTSLRGMPEMPKLVKLSIVGQFENLKDMLKALPSLVEFNLTMYGRLTSLEGMPEMPKLVEFNIPESVEDLVDVPKELSSLTKLTICSRRPTNIIHQLPRTPKLRHLVITNLYVKLVDLCVNQSSLKILDLTVCYQLKSLDGLPSYPCLEILYAPRSVRKISKLAEKLPSLKSLYLESKYPQSTDRMSWIAGKYQKMCDRINHRWKICWASNLPQGCRISYYQFKFVYDYHPR
ncbi:uncharacterized protein BJ171DRAFT_497980 [Polychytrium aggregatum]|uniref:uncharacterized protein n=1 Tax=Polychytrium aggregatum TaxID=110093 RepID=UPI0022FE9C82|nr:uncharacterized protein BJ171DRAFT_497980 [Polychytrium aggregatum]KAI9206474.1 hypothetical protein BJ171DRAFT_497980 [Polychytrium aggregatum]